MITIQSKHTTIMLLKTHYLVKSSKLLINKDNIYVSLDAYIGYINYIKNNIMDLFNTDTFMGIYYILDYIQYENKDKNFIRTFIKFIIDNNITIHDAKYFMIDEIKSINNRHETIDIQLRTCTPIYYELYLDNKNAYEYVIKHNRLDIYINDYMCKYLRYIHKYNNTLTNIVKKSDSYIEYISYVNANIIKDIKYQKFKHIKEYINIGGDINIIFEGYSLLSILTKSHIKKIQFELIQHIIEAAQRLYGYNTPQFYEYINHKNKDSTCALTFSVISCNVKLINYYLDIGMNINATLTSGNTLLYLVHNNIKIIKLLLEKGININTQNIYGNNILHYILKKNKSEDIHEIIKILLKYGVDINVKNKNGHSAHYVAFLNGYDLSYMQNNIRVNQILNDIIH